MILRFLLLLALLFAGVSAQATITEVQRVTSNAAGDQSISVTSVGAGNTLLVFASMVPGGADTIAGVSDGQGSYTQLANLGRTASTNGGGIWKLENANSGTHTVVVDTATGGTWGTVIIIEVSGVGTSGVTDGASTLWVPLANYSNSTDGLSGTAITTTASGDKIISVAAPMSTNETQTAGTGYTLGADFTGTVQNHVYSESKTQTTAGSVTATWTPTLHDDAWIVHTVAVQLPSTLPNITSISAAPWRNGATLTLTGTNLKASGNSTITMGGVSQTVTLQSATVPQFTAARGTNKYGTTLNIILTDSGSVASNTYTGMTGLSPQSGWDYIDLTTPNATAAYRITAAGDIASGDQIAYDTKSGLVDIFADGTFSADPSITSFTVEVWTSAGGWGSTALQLINPSSGRAFLHSARTASGTGVLLRSWTAPVYQAGVGNGAATISSYKVKWGYTSGTYTQNYQTPDATTLSYTMTGLLSGLVYYTVVAIDSNGVESDPMPEGSATIP